MNPEETTSELRRIKRRGKRRIRLSLPQLPRKDQAIETPSNYGSTIKRLPDPQVTKPCSPTPSEHAGRSSQASIGFSRWIAKKRQVRSKSRKRRVTLTQLEDAKFKETEVDEEEGGTEIAETMRDGDGSQINQEGNFEDDSLDEGRRRSLYSIPGAFRVSRMIINNTEVEEIHLEDISIESSFTTKTPPVLIPKASLVPERNQGTECGQEVPVAFPQSNLIYFSKRNVFCCIGIACFVFVGMMTGLLMASWGKPSKEGKLGSPSISQPPRIFDAASNNSAEIPSIEGLLQSVGKPSSKSSSRNEFQPTSSQTQEPPLNEDTSTSFVDISMEDMQLETNPPTETPLSLHPSFSHTIHNPTQHPSLPPTFFIPTTPPSEFKSPQPSKSPSRSPPFESTNSPISIDSPESNTTVPLSSFTNLTTHTENDEWSLNPSIAPEENTIDLWGD